MAWLGVSQEEIAVNPTANANSNEDDNFTQSLTQLQYIWYITEKSTLRSSVFYNYLDGNYDFDLNNFLGLTPTDEMYNYAFESHFGGMFTNYTYETSTLRWTTGIQSNKYRRDHTGTERTLGKLYKNTGFKNEVSAFSKALWEVGNTILYTDLQVRHTNFDYTGTAPFSKASWTFFNPKAGITYNLNARQAVYYSIGRAGREPTRNDMFGGMDDLAVDSLGMPVLSITEPEFVVDHELGFRTNTEKIHANINLYYMNFDNEIVLNGQFGPNGLALNSNVEQSIRTGVEFSLSYDILPNVKLVNNSSYNHSKIRQQDETFEPILTPSLIINQELIYSVKRIETSLSARYQSSSYIDFANDNALDSYFLVNWRGTYQFKNWALSVFVNNVTDIQYFNNGYVDYDGTNKYFIQAPRNFYGMLSYSF